MRKTPLLLLPVAMGLVACTNTHQDKMNVLMIMVDDMKDWTGFLGGYEGTVHTPNMDRLASEGVVFENAHCAASVSCPSRNATMSGLRPSTSGLYDNNQWWKADCPDMVPLPQYFKQNGYYTTLIGKIFHHTPGNNPPCCWNECMEQIFDDPWRLSSPDVDEYFISGNRGPITPNPSWKPLCGVKGMDNPMDWGAIPGKHESEYGDVLAADYFEDFIGRKQKDPFFCAVGFYRPHIPWHVPQKYYDMYPLEEIVLPEILEADLDDVPEVGRQLAMAKHGDFTKIRDAGKYKEAVQAYLACITFADDQVGRILKALEKSGKADNTIVVLCSDHGWHLGSKGHWHKQTLWEEATHIPFIMRVPGMEPRKTQAPVDLINLFPTLVSLCDLPAYDILDGHDMTCLLEGEEDSWNYPAITEIKEGNMAVRDRRYRYIRYHDGGEELYDLEKDPLEWNNVVALPAYASIKQELAKWIPTQFANRLPSKSAFMFDPHDYTFINIETKEFIDATK